MRQLLESRAEALRAGHVLYRGMTHECGSRIRYAKNGACQACVKKAARKNKSEASDEYNRNYAREYAEKKSLYEDEIMAYARQVSFGKNPEPPEDPWRMFDRMVSLWVRTPEIADCYGRKATGLWLAFERWVRENHPEARRRMIGGRNSLSAAMRRHGCVFASAYRGGGLAAVPAPAPADDDPWGGL